MNRLSINRISAIHLILLNFRLIDIIDYFFIIDNQYVKVNIVQF